MNLISIKLSLFSTDQEFLENIQIKSGDKVLILSPFNGTNDIDSSDAQTLFTLINLRY